MLFRLGLKLGSHRVRPAPRVKYPSTIVRFESRVELRVVEAKSGSFDSNSQRQVVFVLGWTNASVKNLRKYSEIYEKEGHAVVSWCPTATMVYGLDPRREFERQRDILMETLKELRTRMLPANPTIFFHVFSGGIFTYYLICRSLEHPDYKDIRIGGSVFDSTLASSKFSLVYRAMRTVAPGNQLGKSAVAFGGAVVTYFVILSNVVKDLLSRGDASDTENYRFFNYAMICHQPDFGPQLFLYSRADRVIDHESVTRLIEKRRQLGVEVRSRMWLDSPHVKHFQYHRDEYLRLLEDFRSLCRRRFPVSVYDVVQRDQRARQFGLVEKWERR